MYAESTSFNHSPCCIAPQTSILSIMLDMASGLEHLHSKNIIHGGEKLSIMFDCCCCFTPPLEGALLADAGFTHAPPHVELSP